MNEVKSLTFTNIILYTISAIGGLLVGEQLITGEQLTEIQGVIGMVLAGGGITASAIIYAIKIIVPTMIVKLLLGNVKKTNPETYDKLVSTFKEPQALIAMFTDVANDVKRILEIEEAKQLALDELTRE